MDYKKRTAVSRQSILTEVTKALGFQNRIQPFLVDPNSDPWFPVDKSEYDSYRRYMHELAVHGILDSGLYESHSFKLELVGITSNDNMLNRQKPDLYTLFANEIQLGEVAVTNNLDFVTKKKERKYDDFIAELRGADYMVSYNVHIVDMTDPEWPLKFPKISDLHRQMLEEMIENLRLIHADPHFAPFAKMESSTQYVPGLDFEYPEAVFKEKIKEAIGVTEEPSETNRRLEMGGKDTLTDPEYVHFLAKAILRSKPLERPEPRNYPVDPKELIDDWEAYKSIPPTKKKLPKILQLGAPSIMMEEPQSSLDQHLHIMRTTKFFGGYLDFIKSSLQISNPDENTNIIKLSLSADELEREQMQGPGRKSLLKRQGLIIEREEPVHIGISQDHTAKLYNLADKIKTIPEPELLETSSPEMETVGMTMYVQMRKLIEHFSTDRTNGVLKFYQRLSTEITINSMRRRKGGEYVLGYSGFRGVYFLVAPGPQLRTESNTEFVKVISFVPPICDELSAEWDPVGNHWESKWLSVDTNRLKHWQRASDRCQLSMLANVERLVEPGKSFNTCFDEELTNDNLFLLAMTYLEDKQLTSVTNQTIRYLWVKSLGDKSLKSIMSKFPSRVNSVVQSTMLQRSVEWAIKMCNTNLSEIIKMPNVRRNEESGNYDESTTGVVGKLPRIFTCGPDVPISYNLNEIYWCMAYNKDRQNATQDALGILGKIFKEEKKFCDEVDKRQEDEKIDYLFGTTTIEEDINHASSENPESHYFSMRAVQTGLRLQDKHEHNFGSGGTWKTTEKLTSIFNLNLSEFATFKASVKEISRHINPCDLKEVEKLGCRTKAIELVAELVKSERLLNSVDVLMQFSGEASERFEVFIQIFKKGQIGGIREIIILYIKARIIFRLTEDIAKLLSKSDKREILTKGRDKRHMMRGDFEELMASFPEGTNVKMVKNSYDMTTWAQKFIPTIFMAIGQVQFSDFKPIRDLYRMLFMAHVNKKIEYPVKLVEQWMKHPQMKHKDNAYMQSMKEKFLNDGVPYFLNKSNMCQGIPHYSSSVLALSCQSLRDALFEECLVILGQKKHISWRTRVGSDDKGDLIALDMSTPLSYLQYKTFEQCAAWSERLHSMELSVKSASGHVIYELNSAFMSNLEILSPTIKFTMAAADCIGTTSCTSFVNESYTRIRQMRENGCSSLLTGMAHLINQDHFYWIFDTKLQGGNSPERAFGQPKKEIPYDFGIYPFYDVDLQDIIGPEFHNYMACVVNGPNKPACKLLFTEVKDSDTTEFLDEDGVMGLFKKDHFGIKQGLVKQLAGMRRRVGSDPDSIKEFFEKNPFLLVRGPETVEETENVICSKLHTKGAAESLRRTNPAIYIGRLAAFRSAKAWSVRSKVPNFVVDLVEGTRDAVYNEELVTYNEFLEQSKELSEDWQFDIHDAKKLVFPQAESFEVVRSFVGNFGPMRTTDRKYSQAVRTWVTNTYNYEFSSSIKSILETSIGVSQSSPREEVEEMKKLLGFGLKSLDQISEECREKGIKPLDLYFYISRILKVSSMKKAQVFASGPSTSSAHMTAINVKKFNHIPGMVMALEAGITEDALAEENRMDNKVDVLKLYTNLKLMSYYNSTVVGKFNDYTVDCRVNGSSLSEWCETIVRSVKSIRSFDRTTQKVFRYAASQLLEPSEFKEKLTAWRVLNYSYVKRQKKTVTARGQVNWTGPLRVLVNSGNECYEIHDDGSGEPMILAKKITELDTFFLSLKDMSRILDIPVSKFFRVRNIQVGDIYQSDNKKMLVRAVNRPISSKQKLRVKFFQDFRFKALTDFNSFSVSTNYDEKVGSLEVFLNDGRNRSAAICHFTGSLFHMSVPHNVSISGQQFLGVDLGYVLSNRDFFSNGRMPMTESSAAVNELKTKIDWTIFGQQKELTANRIQSYLEVREEVNEEAFNLGELQEPGRFQEDTSITEFGGETLNQMFQDAMDQIDKKLFQGLGESDWADYEEVDDTRANEDSFEELLNREDEKVIGVMRAIGYKRPARRMNFGQITLLQLGAVMLSSAMDRFFLSGSILRESKRDLPGYYVWLYNYKPKTGTSGFNFEIVRKLLLKYILMTLDKTYGFSASSTGNLLKARHPSLGKPMTVLVSIAEGLSETSLDLLDSLFQAQAEGCMDSDDESIESDNVSES
ncbi:RNA-dependent RNA polymerase [Fusarium poae negative-stranded virus 2]|uniref:RNA-dependent RNA polymerase n=1 Tax=Fusarium poae negative-stranded virus 2 TaxID=1849545 RepID=UPI000847DBD2|nr:RNA-dependent RNA polymerase [Fusarium poae negative-stranded virus 2]BAV56313.1 RNA-dependent RNA polymerase [Fusarium poae negative-stranded virus 2]